MGRIPTTLFTAAAAWLTASTVAIANPFMGGWTLDADNSTLNFQSTKNQTIVETSAFATFSGAIDETGDARVTVELESVDTGIDLRNVRMRFLFFESFQYPQATISARIDPAELEDLEEVRRKIVTLPYEMTLHGITKTKEARIAVTLLTNDRVNISTPTPITVPVLDYDLMGGVQKLQEAAGVEIVPQAAVTFDFTFTRNPVAIPTQEDAPEQSPDPAVPVDDLVAQNDGGETSPTDQSELPTAPTGLALVSVALEPEGNFTEDACRGRFEILSRTDNITFGSGSSRLTENSVFLLDSLADIIARCPGMVIEIGGHTDNVGTDAANLRLSDRRAASVVEYLTEKGITQGVLQSRGYGEAKPAFDNGTPEGRQRNRRIEFTVVGS